MKKLVIADEPFAKGYLECTSECVAMKIAKGMLSEAENVPLALHPEWGLAGFSLVTTEPIGEQGVYWRFGDGIVVNPDRLHEKIKENPENAGDYQYILDSFHGKGTQQLVEDGYSDEEKKFIKNNALWGGCWGGHCNIDFGMFVHMGTEKLIEKIRHYRSLHPDKTEWYDAVETAVHAVETVGDRYHNLALEYAAKADKKNKLIYMRIAEALETVPRKPPKDFFSACQSFFLIYTFDVIDSPGRFDQYMYEYYKTSDKQDARNILEGIWIAFHDMRAWNLTVGGSNENWEDETNELSYEILDVSRCMGYNTPNLSMRWHRNTCDSLLYAAAKSIATGTGLPAMYNDEAVCPALEKQNIPACDSHLYTMNGCNQIDIMGKSHMGLEDGEICLLKILEYTLFNGYDLLSGEKVSISTGDAREFTTYEELTDAYKKQIRYALERTVTLANRSQRIFAENAPNPLRSALVEGCLEKGKDYSAGGPIYNMGQILTEGLADAADSLTAIKHFVFDTNKLTMDQLLNMLKADFNGYESYRLKLANYPAKFGNDIEEADATAAWIQRFFFTEMTKYHTWRDPINGTYGGGLSTFNRTGRYGSSAGASANGRHARDIHIADSIGATPGKDINGPTAALCSAMKYDHSLATSGFVMQLKFDKAIFNTDKGLKSFVDLVKTYFEGGGQQLSINVLDHDELLDAKEHPEDHQNLIVRVGGYSDYFVKLSPELQENIISRTIQAV